MLKGNNEGGQESSLPPTTAPFMMVWKGKCAERREVVVVEFLFLFVPLSSKSRIAARIELVFALGSGLFLGNSVLYFGVYNTH